MSDEPVQTPEDWAKAFGQFLKEHPGPNIGHAKLRPSDDFYDVKEQERKVIARIDTESANLQSAIILAERMVVIKASPGWAPFVKAVEDMRAYRRVELELSAGTTAELRILQGRCKELGAILSLMNQTEQNKEVLTSRLLHLEAEKAAYVREDGKVVPIGAVS